MLSRLALFAALFLGSLLFGLTMLATALSGGAALPVALVLGMGLLALVLFTRRRATVWREEGAFSLSGTAWKWLSWVGALLSGLGAVAAVLDDYAPEAIRCTTGDCAPPYGLMTVAFVFCCAGGWLASAALLGAYGLLRAISPAAVWAVAISVGAGTLLLFLAVNLGP